MLLHFPECHAAGGDARPAHGPNLGLDPRAD